jgi:hypothetical protein
MRAIPELSNEDVTVDHLQRVEVLMMQNLEYRLLTPTSCDYVKLLLYFANDEQPMEDIITRANNLSLMSILIYETAHNKRSSIALASLLIALEEREYFNFCMGLKNLIISEGLAFDLDETRECHAKICEVIMPSQAMERPSAADCHD